MVHVLGAGQGDRLNIRSAPDIGAAIVTRLSDGTQVQILDGPRSADGYTWWRVQTSSGAQGWAVDYVDGIRTLVFLGAPISLSGNDQDVAPSGCPIAPSRLSVNQIAVANDNLRVRSRPGTTSQQVADLGTGTATLVVEGPACVDNARWWKIRVENWEGWVVEIIAPYNIYLLLPQGTPLGAKNNRWNGS